MIRTTLVVGALVGLVGCAVPKPYTLGKVFQAVPQPPEDKAQIVFYFPPISGIDNTVHLHMYQISEDDEVVSGLVKQSYAIHTTAPGPHEYLIGGRYLNSLVGISEVSLAPQAGKTYYLRFQFTSLAIVAWVHFEEVPESVALEELETLRQLRFHKDIYAAEVSRGMHLSPSYGGFYME